MFRKKGEAGKPGNPKALVAPERPAFAMPLKLSWGKYNERASLTSASAAATAASASFNAGCCWSAVRTALSNESGCGEEDCALGGEAFWANPTHAKHKTRANAVKSLCTILSPRRADLGTRLNGLYRYSFLQVCRAAQHDHFVAAQTFHLDHASIVQTSLDEYFPNPILLYYIYERSSVSIAPDARAWDE